MSCQSINLPFPPSIGIHVLSCVQVMQSSLLLWMSCLYVKKRNFLLLKRVLFYLLHFPEYFCAVKISFLQAKIWPCNISPSFYAGKRVFSSSFVPSLSLFLSFTQENRRSVLIWEMQFASCMGGGGRHCPTKFGRRPPNTPFGLHLPSD